MGVFHNFCGAFSRYMHRAAYLFESATLCATNKLLHLFCEFLPRAFGCLSMSKNVHLLATFGVPLTNKWQRKRIHRMLRCEWSINVLKHFFKKAFLQRQRSLLCCRSLLSSSAILAFALDILPNVTHTWSSSVPCGSFC